MPEQRLVAGLEWRSWVGSYGEAVGLGSYIVVAA